MKKITTITIIMLMTLSLNAQSVYKLLDGKEISRELIDIPASLLAVILVFLFLLNAIKWILNYRLKSKMIDNDVSNDIINQLLQPGKNETRQQAIKWFIILMGIAIGLTIISFFQPLGIHSLAIMIFSIAISFLAYYFYLRRSEK